VSSELGGDPINLSNFVKIDFDILSLIYFYKTRLTGENYSHLYIIDLIFNRYEIYNT